MQSTKFRPGRVREAGSLEMSANTTNRALTRNTLTEVERSHQYDSLFNQDAEKPQPNKQQISSQNKRSTKSNSYLDYDLDRIDVERSELTNNEDFIDESAQNQKTKSGKSKESKTREKEKMKPKQHEIKESTSEEEEEEEEMKEKPVSKSSRHQHENKEKSSNNSRHDLNHAAKKTPLKEKQDQQQQKPSEAAVSKFTSKNNPFLAKSINVPRKSYSSSLNDDDEYSEENEEDDNDDDDAQIRPDSTNAASSSSLPRNNFDMPFFRDQNDADFMLRAAPDNVLIRCEILVHPNKLSANDFELFLEDSPRDSPLLSTSSKRAMSGVYLNISANIFDPVVRVYRQKKLGKLRSDLGRREFQLHEILNSSQMNVQRFELYYKKQSLANPLPKEFELFLRSTPINEAGAQYSYRFISKPPVFDKEKRTYKLDFKGRAKKASANNMQLVDPAKLDQVLWQLGKVQKNHYILDFSYPFSLFLAFSIALSCLNRT